MLLATVGPTALGDLPLARLTSIFPPGGQAGQTVEVTVAGIDLDGARELIFSHPKIAGKPLAGPKPGEFSTNRFAVTIDGSVTPGTYEARVAGRFGVSNPRLFTVTDLPEMVVSSNRPPSAALVIPVPVVVNARADAARIAAFKVRAERGERLLIECAAQEIDSKMEPSLILESAEGTEVARARSKGLLDFTSPADADFILTVHDLLFRGGDDFWYRLTVSARPHLDYIFPLAGQPGTKAPFALYGRNLPGGVVVPGLMVQGSQLTRLDVEIDLPHAAVSGLTPGAIARASGSLLESFPYRFQGSNGVSNPVLIGLASNPVLREIEPNDSPDESQKLDPPCEVDGSFHPSGDRDWFAIEARKGDTYWIELFSQRLGFPVSPFLLVQRVNQKDGSLADVQEVYAANTNVGGPEYNTASRDPAWRFEPKESGLYKIQIRDLFDSSTADPRRLYRLMVRSETPDFTLIATPQPPPPPDKEKREGRVWTTLLRAGETLPIRVMALRRDNFDGEIRLSAEELPPGVTGQTNVIEAGQSSASLLLTASDKAGDWTGPIRIVGTARLGDIEAVRVARSASVLWEVNDYNTEVVPSRLTADLWLAVASQEPAPAALLVEVEKGFEAHPGEKLQIPVKLAPRAELTGTVKVKAAGLPALDSMKELEVSAKTNQATLEIDLAQQKLPLGTHQLYLIAQAQTKYRRSPSQNKADAEKQPAEERQFKLYSGLFSVRITPAPAATAATK
ncbi:MAG: hypothetical protein U1G07_03840 [Verrucomicrobiota bacterium]